MKKMRRLALIITVLTLSLCSAAYAYDDWPQFQQDTKNTGIYDQNDPALPTTTGQVSVDSVFTEAAGFFGIDSTPIYVTSQQNGGHVYVFPYKKIFEYYTDNGSLVQRSTPQEVDIGGFQLSTPASDGNSIFLGVNTMLNMTTNQYFATSLDGWTPGSEFGSPSITQTTAGGIDQITGIYETHTCARIYEDTANTDGDGWVQQTVSVRNKTNVRIAFSYLLQKTGTNPTQKDIIVQVKRVNDPDEPASWRTALTTTGDYDTWVPVDISVSSTCFPTGATGDKYDVRFKFDYKTGLGLSTVAACFTDCQVICQSMGVKKVTGLGSGSLTVDHEFCVLDEPGQANTPVKYYKHGTNEYLLLGSWTGGSGSKYFCINATDGDDVKWRYGAEQGGAPDGYYWAGAAVVDDVAIFGDEKGKVHVVKLEPDPDGDPVEVDQVPGGDIDPYDLTMSDHYIRSSISYYDNPSGYDYLYLTTRDDGRLYQLTYDPVAQRIVGEQSVVPGSRNYSTSTPVRHGNWIYAGMGGPSGVDAGLWAQRVDNNGNFVGTPVQLATGLGLRAIQSSPVVYPVSATQVYIYLTENQADGRAVCVGFNPSIGQTTGTEVLATSRNYTLQGLAAADGKLFYGDDSGWLHYITIDND